MNIDISGDALCLLEQFLRHASLSPQRLADAMGYDQEGFACHLHCLDKALRKAMADAGQTKTVHSKKGQPPLPDDFDQRFPELLVEKIREWLTYKTERRDFYSPTGLHNLLTQIDKHLAAHPAELIADLITECMANNWKGIIWDRIERQSIHSSDRRDRRSADRRSRSGDNPWIGFFDD